MHIKYPEVRRDESIIDNYHGIEVKDPYRWLEDPYSEETKAFVEAQNKIANDYINENQDKEKIFNSISELWNFPKEGVPYRYGNKYFHFKNSGLQNQFVLYTKDNLQSNESTFLDPNVLSDDGTVALSGWSFSENGKYFAYGLSQKGSDWIHIKFKNAENAKDYDDLLEHVKFSPITWLHNNEGILYGAYLNQTKVLDGSETDTVENQKLYYHKLGTTQSEDILAVEFEDSQLRINADVSDCGNYVIVTPRKGCKNNLVYISLIKDKSICGKLELKEIVGQHEADFEFVANNGEKFIFRTNKNAPNYKLITIDFANPEEPNWVDLIPENPKDVLDFTMPIDNNKLVVRYMRDVKHVLQLHDMHTGEKIYDFNLEVGSVVSLSGRREYKEMFYSFTSFLTPTKIFRVDFSSENVEVECIHETKVGNHDTALYNTEQIFYKSKDGTEVPMFILYKKGLVKDGSKPCQLYGYGGFNISLTPGFSITRLLFIKHFDGIFAVANIRGGGEYGDKWHNGGRFENKQNCFDDFQYAGKYLVEMGYTSNNKLIINGGSNGGLLVAACINQAPNLFGAAVCQVGVLDMLRYHKFTIGYAWKSDYGCSDNPEEFEYLYKYSPLHNIRMPEEGQYPAVLLLTADHDDRVVPLHSLKFISELQFEVGKHPKQTNPLLVKIETSAGHGAGKPTTKIIEDYTDIFCFLARALNVELKF